MANTKVTTNVIADDAITGAKIADDAIDSEHYTNASIDTAHIAASQITNALMADDAISTAEIADDVALGGNPTTTTQSAGNSTTRVATTAFVATEVANLIDSSPGALNTLNELAAAIGDDASFSTTVTNSIATKLPLAGGTLTGNIAHAGNFTLDVGGYTELNNDNAGTVIFADASVQFGVIEQSSSDWVFRAGVQDKDIVFKGNDGGSTVTAMTIDMSAGGKVGIGNTTPATKLDITGDSVEEDMITFRNNSGTSIGAIRIHDGAFYIKGHSASDEVHLQTTDGREDINLNPAGYIQFEVDGSERFRMAASGQLGIGGTNYGTDGQVLTSTGASTAPAWEDAAGGATALDGLSDAKSAGTNFTNSLLIGHQTHGTLSSATGNTGVGIASLDALVSATGCTAVGFEAATAINSGGDNTAFGFAALATATTGAGQTAIGALALNKSTVAAYNTAVGYAAMKFHKDQNGNTALGYRAAQGVLDGTSATKSVWIGMDAGFDVTSGSKNVVIGYLAAQQITTADNSIYIGAESGCTGDPTVGDDNVAIGFQSAQALGTGGANVLIGSKSGQMLNNDDANVDIGHEAGRYGATGPNVFIGRYAGRGSGPWSGSTHNVAIGYNAMAIVEDNAVDNVAIGSYALDALTGGDKNTAIGYNALTANTTADQNVAIGRGAMTNNQTGTRNTAVGTAAMDGNDGDDNTAVGFSAMIGTTSGDKNTAVGSYALDANTSGSWNTAVGYGALTALSLSGQYCTALGFDAGKAVTTGGYNTMLGWRAGETVVSGSANVFVGPYCGTGITGSNNVCIGKDSGVESGWISITSGSNNAVVGNGSITNAYCKVSFATSSDSRDKAEQTNFSGGLAWVNAMQPITYKWDSRRSYCVAAAESEDDKHDITAADILAVTPDGTHKEDSLEIGLTAQAVLAIEQAHGYASNNDTSLIVDLNPDETAYSMKYERLVPVLISAIKELSAKVEALENA